eukprot:jgi/Chrzof1/12250/Cz06g27060.t1
MQQLRHLFKSKSAKHTLTKLGVTLQVSEWLSNYSGLEELLLSITVTILAVVAFGPLCSLFGGALFNPVHNAAFIMAGKGSFKFNAARMAAQLAGALAGSIIAVNILPDWLQQHFPKLPGGLKAGVELEIGFAVEALFGLLLNMVVLYSMETQHKRVAFWTPIVATIMLVQQQQQQQQPLRQSRVHACQVAGCWV